MSYDLRVYNTLSKKVEEFKPLDNKRVNMFVCGPTVYDNPHIGHARSYIVFDIIAKWLKKSFNVFYLQNITDIDDKIINKSLEESVSWRDIAFRFEKSYFEDMKALGVDSVDRYAKATEFVDAIINQVQRLLDNGFAYVTSDGIYFDISKFKDYGKLSGQSLEQLKPGARVDVSSEKHNPYDFALWKFSKPNEPVWKASFGDGRPGWHIEDTAITMTLFGEHYDLHGGGLDLIFPHHDCEIAIAESLTNRKPFVRYWLHNGFVNVKGEKMSKSLKNFVSVKELLERYPNAKQVVRMFVASVHYRSPIDFSFEHLELSKERVLRIKNFLNALVHCKGEGLPVETFNTVVVKAKQEFEQAMNNDFDTPKALAVVFKLVRILNNDVTNRKLSEQQAVRVLDFFRFVDAVLGIVEFPDQPEIPEEVARLVEEREKARKVEDFKKADELRNKIKQLGFYVDDTNSGPIVKKLE